MEKLKRCVLLADDDEDDCFLFQEALTELSLSTQLTTVQDGEQLMQLLTKSNFNLPEIVFLDLNMPRKNGFECLIEIKQNQKLKQLAVVIYSTSYQPEVVEALYENGAQFYIRKPSGFKELKEVIRMALSTINENTHQQPLKKDFMLA